MKTSNIIVVSMIASITLLITTGMMEFRIRGVRRGSVAHEPRGMKQTSIPAFHFVVIQNCRNVSLEASDGFSIGMMPDLPDSVARPLCEVQNDTLYIKGIPDSERGDLINVNAPAQQIKLIRAVNTQITVNNLSLDQFVIRLDRSRVSIDTQQAINKLVVEGVNESRVDFFQTTAINTLDLNLDHTEIYTSGAMGKLTGSLKNQSRVQLNDANELSVTKDNTSRVQVWGN
jgi:hypothetical protein